MAGKSAVISVIVTGEASGAKKAFEQGEEAAKGFRKEAEKVEKGFEGLRDGADNGERRIIGFRDSLTGTSDVMTGFRDGDLVTLATGFADLASSVANLGADLLDWGKKGVQAGKDFVKGQAAVYAAKAKDVIVTGAQKAANLASTAATQAQTAAQWLLNAAMNANPVLLVVTALAALTAGFVIAYNKSETFRDIVNGALGAVKDIAEDVAGFFTDDIPAAFQATLDTVSGVFGWVRDNWPLLTAILTGPIGLAVLAIAKNWDTIKAGISGVKDWVGQKVDEIVGFFTGLPARLSTAAGDLWGWIKSGFITAYDGLRWVINQVKLPSVTIGGWSTPFGKLPSWTSPEIDPLPDLGPIKLAKGGITTGPTLALIGDNPGGREAVIPLPANGMLGGGPTIIIQGDVYGEADFLRKLENALAQLNRRGSAVIR